ncbi:hypothetical protein Btru_015382 [Bulinus truncatus]|nr:hypothetical protein Btru_015382 [Bulinus truncatus]
MDEDSCLNSWNSFYRTFQDSKILFSQASTGNEIAVKNAGTSLLFDTGGEFARKLFKNCGLLGGDVVKLNYILWKLEEASLPKVIVMYESFKKAEGALDEARIPFNSVTPPDSIDSGNIILAHQQYVIDDCNFNFEAGENTTVIVHEVAPEAVENICHTNRSSDKMDSCENIIISLATEPTSVIRDFQKSAVVNNDSIHRQKYSAKKTLISKRKLITSSPLTSQQIIAQTPGCRRSSRPVKISPKFMDISNTLMKSIKPELMEDEKTLSDVAEETQTEEQESAVQHFKETKKTVSYRQAPLMCSICKDSSFRNPSELKRHWLSHETCIEQMRGKPFMCNICMKNWSTYLSLKLHYRKAYWGKKGLNVLSVEKGEKSLMPVSTATKTFRLQQGLINHMRRHNPSKMFQCDQCPKIALFVPNHLWRKEALEYHLRAHRGEKTHVCELCGERFVNPNSLKVHYRRHTGEKPYKCSFCPKSFSQQGTLIAHERYHKGEKPYVCGTCGEGFTTKSHLTIHVRKHTNDRPYKCDLCDYAGTTKSLLNVHLLRHSSIKPFKCTVCPAAFKRQHHLDGHLRKHADREQMYQCSFCDQAYLSEEKLKKHMRSHEIVVVSTATEDDIFHINNTNRDEGPVEVAYDIILL